MYCGEVRSDNDPAVINSNSQYKHELPGNRIVDSNVYKTPNFNWIYGRGYLINECFETEANVALRPDDRKDPTYLVGYALKDMKKGEELLINYGKQYWCIKAHYDTLNEETQKRCKKHYGIANKDIK